MSELNITYKDLFDINKFKQLVEKYGKEQIHKSIIPILQHIENEIAILNKRKPAFVTFEELHNCDAQYNAEQHTIALNDNLYCEPMEYITKTIHESNHANQELSELYSKNEKICCQISAWLYPITDEKQLTIDYTCNYLELLSKTEEIEKMIKFYNENKDNILDYATGKSYYQMFQNEYNAVVSITEKHINIVQKRMLKSARNLFIKLDPRLNISRKKIIKILKSDMPVFYEKSFKKFEQIQKEFLSIYTVLREEYVEKSSETILKYEKLKEENIRKQKENIQVIKSRINVKDIMDVDYTKESDTMFFENLNDYTNFLKNVKYPIFIISEDFQENEFHISFYVEDKVKSDEEQKPTITQEKVEDKIKDETRQQVQNKEIEDDHDEL